MSVNDTQEEKKQSRLSAMEEEQRPEAFDSERGKVLGRILKPTDPDRTISRQRT